MFNKYTEYLAKYEHYFHAFVAITLLVLTLIRGDFFIILPGIVIGFSICLACYKWAEKTKDDIE